MSETVAREDNRERALAHARDLIQAWEAAKADKSPFNVAKVESRAEALFAFLLDTFHGEITAEQSRELVSGNRDYLARDVLDALPDPFVPLAIIRTVIFRHRVMFSPQRTVGWKVFNERYGRLIAAA
jgi:hypothetical protein